MNKYLAIGISVVIYLLASFLSYSYFEKGRIAQSRANYKPPAGGETPTIDNSAPKTEECPINGEMLTKAHRELWEQRRPLGVIIENHEESRPQSGLSSADVVYEAVAEGGITRFLAVFYCKDSVKYVGPVRSARVYFIHMLSEYGSNPLFTHVGAANCNKETGSGCANGAPADARGLIADLGWTAYNDMDFVPFPAMWRDYNRLPGVATEHTVYSTTAKLWDYANTKRGLTNVDDEGNEWDKAFTQWEFKDDEPAAAAVNKISFDFWDGKSDYSVRWDYNTTANTYKRSNGGQPHMDKNTGKQIESKNVMIVFMAESIAKDGYDAGQHMLYQTTGEGDGIFFLDGKAIEGTWEKEDTESRMKFYDDKGKELLLNRGQVFVEIVPEGNTVDY